MSLRDQIIAQLMQGGSRPGPYTTANGLNDATSKILGALLTRQQEDKAAQAKAIDAQGRKAAMADIIGALSGRPAETQQVTDTGYAVSGDPNNPVTTQTGTAGQQSTIKWNEEKPDPMRAIARAMSREDTAPLGSMIMQGQQQQQQFDRTAGLQREMVQGQQAFQREMTQGQQAFQRDMAQSGQAFAASQAEQQRAAEREMAQASGGGRGQVQTITTADGIFTVNPDGTLGNRLGAAAPRDGGNMSPTVQKELFETEDTLLSSQAALSALSAAAQLNEKSFAGVGAGAKTWIARNTPFGDDQKGANTTEFSNIVTGQALESLKATFGGAPTEGERKILLDLQAAPEYSVEERRRIIERAQAAVERRIAYNAQKAEQLRSGQFFRQGGGGPANPAAQQPSAPQPPAAPGVPPLPPGFVMGN